MEYKTTVKEVDNMWGELYQQGVDIIVRFFDKTILLLSCIFGIFLSQIGFPKEILLFICILTIIDLITKHLSIVVVNYGSLSLKNYKQGWIDQKLTSRQLKNGVCLKVILYSFALYIANQMLIIDGILFGKEVSGIIYSALVFVELASILENGINCGCSGLSPFLNYIKNKQKEIFNIKEDK